MTKHNCDGYLDEIQERMDGDVFKAMLEVMAQRVMGEELTRRSGVRSSAAAIAMGTRGAA